MSAALQIVTYHYIRDPDKTLFPGIKAISPGRFGKQLRTLQDRYEMATLESALDFLNGNYKPSRDLCLLTFDDGLKDHYFEVTPLLVDMALQGLFFVITSSLEENIVAAVHMNHLLMGSLEFEAYERSFMERLDELFPAKAVPPIVDPMLAQRTYRWDKPKVALFKYLLNFSLDATIRDEVIKSVFEEHIGPENSIARTLYLSWEEGRQMQAAGMVFGGHSHRHRPFANLQGAELDQDSRTCMRLLVRNLQSQPLWPFCYPYGSVGTFNGKASELLKRLGFACSFSTETGTNTVGSDLFALRRTDCNDVG